MPVGDELKFKWNAWKMAGAIGMHVAKKNGDGCGLGIAGLVIGIITTVFWLLILIFAASLVAAIL